ncbi:hypothetical protein BWI17_06825 [Betaproteobacteria bacterium GR16-43]|nr:hypothetical protein BWI17_06825 [Betaproteobacteria bacterium GR16-43]
MALHGDAAMLLYFDIDGDLADHDHWHTYEHLHERLSIPGFLRGTRWLARSASPRYLVVYEVDSVAVATSDAYLARLNNPTPWTAATMKRLRGMIRGFSTVVASRGYGLGQAALSLRFSPDAARQGEARDWLGTQVLPAMAARRGIASACLLEPAPPPPMTREQSIRGKDAQLPWVLLATAYDADALDPTSAQLLDAGELARHGISGPMEHGTYSLSYTVTAEEVARTPPNPLKTPLEET